jgi:LmbE family N-acetylglucosaminyl deacetylase
VDEVQASEQIVRAVRELLPQTLLTWPPDRLSGHPDHIAVSRWTDQAFRQAADPAAYPEHQVEGLLPHAATWLYHLVVPRSLAEMLEMPHLHTVPDEAVTLKVDVSAVWKAKLAAIHCHHTQIGSSPILAASEAKQRLFLGMEYFRLAVSSAEFFSHRAGFAGSAGGIYHTDHPRRSP